MLEVVAVWENRRGKKRDNRRWKESWNSTLVWPPMRHWLAGLLLLQCLEARPRLWGKVEL